MDKTNILGLAETIIQTSKVMKEKMCFANDMIHLSMIQIQTLIFIKKNKQATMTEITKYLSIELPSTTSMVNKLYDQGLVKRTEDDSDRRLVMISLSQKGKKLLEQIVSEHRKKLEKILSYLSNKERQQLLNILQTLNNRLK